MNSTMLTNLTAVPCLPFLVSNLGPKLYIAGFAGTCIALLSILENVFTLTVIVRSTTLRKTPFYYMMWLAVTDITLGVTYILLMSCMSFFMYFRIVWLYEAWFFYERVLFTVNHVMVVAASYLIVIETVERFCGFFKILETMHRWLRTRRWAFVLMMYGWAALNRVNMYFEVYWRQLVSPFLPFLMLTTLNLSTIIFNRRRYFLQQQRNNGSEMHQNSTTSCQSTAAAAQASSPRMFLLLVIIWLCMHALGTFIAVMELTNRRLLLTYLTLYMTLTEFISLTTIISGCIRLPIYICCNRSFAEEARKVCTFLQVCTNGDISRRPSANTRLMMVRNANNQLARFEFEVNAYQSQALLNASPERRSIKSNHKFRQPESVAIYDKVNGSPQLLLINNGSPKHHDLTLIELNDNGMLDEPIKEIDESYGGYRTSQEVSQVLCFNQNGHSQK